MVHEFREVVIALRVLGLGNDDAAGAVLIEGLADLYLAVVALVARGDQDAVAPFPGRLLDLWMASRFSGLMRGLSFNAREMVDTETPKASAISFIVSMG